MIHTPGPWCLSQSARVPALCSKGIDAAPGPEGQRDYFIASVSHDDPEVLLAKAKLVAAAPELLDALADLLTQVGLFCLEHGEADFETAKAVAAIKKSKSSHQAASQGFDLLPAELTELMICEVLNGTRDL